jgi:hypothetical protein
VILSNKCVKHNSVVVVSCSGGREI